MPVNPNDPSTLPGAPLSPRERFAPDFFKELDFSFDPETGALTQSGGRTRSGAGDARAATGLLSRGFATPDIGTDPVTVSAINTALSRTTGGLDTGGTGGFGAETEGGDIGQSDPDFETDFETGLGLAMGMGLGPMAALGPAIGALATMGLQGKNPDPEDISIAGRLGITMNSILGFLGIGGSAAEAEAGPSAADVEAGAMEAEAEDPGGFGAGAEADSDTGVGVGADFESGFAGVDPGDFGFDDDGPGGDGGGGDGGGDSFICTAALAAGLSTLETFNLDRRFGVWLRKNDPYIWAGYQVYGPFIADQIERGRLRWLGKTSPKCWAYEYRRRTGGDTSQFSRGVKIENWLMRVFARLPARAFGYMKVKYDGLQS